MVKDYTIGSDVWNGLSKVQEEMNELGVVLAKIVGNGGDLFYWGDRDLEEELYDELGDLQAIVGYFIYVNGLDADIISMRSAMKAEKFMKWNYDAQQEAARANGED